jgi:hypothetical protein
MSISTSKLHPLRHKLAGFHARTVVLAHDVDGDDSLRGYAEALELAARYFHEAVDGEIKRRHAKRFGGPIRQRP